MLVKVKLVFLKGETRVGDEEVGGGGGGGGQSLLYETHQQSETGERGGISGRRAYGVA